MPPPLATESILLTARG